MTDIYPPLTIQLMTCDRWDYARRTLQSTFRNLRYSGEVALHIADDSRGEGAADQVIDLLQLAGNRPNHSTRTGGHSYGRSYNLATQAVHERGGLVLVLEDDWELCMPLDVDRLADAFDRVWAVGCIRLGYVGYTQELRGRFVPVGGNSTDHLLMLDPASPERHVFAGHPRLETVEWQRKAGPWPEGLPAGQTEFEVAGAVRDGIAWPMWIPPSRAYAHIGTRRARED